MGFASFYTGFYKTMMARPCFTYSFILLMFIATGKLYCCRCFPRVFSKTKHTHFNRTCFPRELNSTRSTPTAAVSLLWLTIHAETEHVFRHNSLILNSCSRSGLKGWGTNHRYNVTVMYNVSCASIPCG